MTENYAEINGINICYSVYGDGQSIVCLHGYGATKNAWIAQIPALSKKYGVVTYDLRGAGKSDRPNIPYTMKMLADDLRGLMARLQIKRAHILGRSLGGMIAQNFALLYPKRVDKLVLITTNYGREDSEWADIAKNGRLEEIKMLEADPIKAFKNRARWVFHQKFRKQMEENPKRKFFGVWSMEDLIKESQTNPSRPQDIINLAEAMKTHYTYEKLNEIKNPTLLIAASHDRQTPVSVMKEMHERIPNSKLEIIENSGHFCTLSRAAEVNQIILDFLED